MVENNIDILEKLVHINRITKVVKGGRRFGFSALVVVGNQNGKIGVAHAKAKQVPDAIKKAGAGSGEILRDPSFLKTPYCTPRWGKGTSLLSQIRSLLFRVGILLLTEFCASVSPRLHRLQLNMSYVSRSGCGNCF